MLPLHGCGAIEDHVDPYDYPASRLLCVDPASPDRVFFENEQTPFVVDALLPRDQGQTSACVGFAVASAVRLVGALRGVGLPALSPLAVYALARELDDGDLSDHGVRPRAALKALQKYGVVAEDRFPFHADNVCTPAPLDVIRAGAVAQVLSYYRVLSSGRERIAELQRAIAQRYVPVFALKITEGYEWVRGGDTYRPFGQDRGSHYQCLVGYSPSKFRVLNSWGSGWADSGKSWISADMIGSELVRDAYVFTLAPVRVS